MLGTTRQVLSRCVDFFIDNSQFDKAVGLCITNRHFSRAIELCVTHKVSLHAVSHMITVAVLCLPLDARRPLPAGSDGLTRRLASAGMVRIHMFGAALRQTLSNIASHGEQIRRKRLWVCGRIDLGSVLS